MPEQSPTSPSRRGRLLRIGAALAVLLGLAGYLLVQYEGGGRRAPRCTVVSANGDGATYEMSLAQAANAATISAVGTSRGLPERAVTIALATALQESGLRNIGHGDRDSVGLFQQRPSQGWGTEKQIMDPVYTSVKFYEHLEKVPGYTRLPLTVAAQKVQRSGYPQAYAKHEPDAVLLSAALTGRSAASLSCASGPDREPGDPAKLRAALTRDFGPDVLPGAKAAGAPADGQTDGRTDGKAGIEQRTVAVPVPGEPAGGDAGTDAGTDDRARRGWELAHWAVAQSGALGIERVMYAGREWNAGDGSDDDGQWRELPDGNGSGASADDVVIVTAQ